MPGVVVRKDGQRTDEGALGEWRLVGLAVAEQQKIESRGIQAWIEPGPIAWIFDGGRQAAALGLEQERMQDALELRFVGSDQRWRGHRRGRNVSRHRNFGPR